MKNNSMLEETAGSSLNCSQNLHPFVNVNSLQQVKGGGRNGSTPMLMDYEFIINNQNGQDRESETSKKSRSTWNDTDGQDVYSEILYDDQFCTTDCEKDVDFDMVIKEQNSSCIDKDENFDMKLKHPEESCSTDKNYEISSSQNNADIETDEDYGMLIKDIDDCPNTTRYSNVEVSSVNNSKIFAADIDKSNNMGNEIDCEAVTRHQAESSNNNNKDEGCINDFFDISDGDEEVESGINLELPCEGEENRNKFTPKKLYVKSHARKQTAQSKYKTANLTEVEKDDYNLRFKANRHFVRKSERNSTSFVNEPYCSQVSQDADNMRNNKIGDIDSMLNYKQGLYFMNDGSLSNLQGDTSSVCDFDRLSPIFMKQKKHPTSDNKHKCSNSTLLSKMSETTSLPLDSFDSVDGLYLSHTDRDLQDCSSNTGSSSVCFQEISDDGLALFTIMSSCGSSSLDNESFFPLCTTSGPRTLHSVQNSLKHSFNVSKAGPAMCSAACNCVQSSTEYSAKDKLFDNSWQGSQSASSDIDNVQYNVNSSSADAASPATSSSFLQSHGRSATGIKFSKRNEQDMNCITQTSSPDENKIMTTKTLSLPASVASITPTCCLSDFDVVNGESETDLGLTSKIHRSLSTDNLKGLEDAFNSVESVDSTQKLQTPSHFLERREKQRNTSSHVHVCKIADISSSIPTSFTSNCPATEGLAVEEACDSIEKQLLSTQCSSAAKSNTLPSVLQVSTSSHNTSVDNPAVTANKRHIKSFLNTYVNHRLKTEAYTNEDINDVADEFALVLKGSRKRPHDANLTNTMFPIKKPYLVGSSVAANSKNPMEEFNTDMKDSLKESKMEMDSVHGSYTNSSLQTKKTVQEYDSAIMLCKICDISSSSSKSIRCRNSHAICQNCLEDEIRLVMASDKVYLSCPVESCKAAITLDSLSSVLPSFILDLLGDNLRLKEQRASAKAIKKMQGLVICPHCSCPGLLEEYLLHFICATCKSSCCRYCKAPWAHQEEHDGCYLLSIVGTECLKDISKLPQNWNLNVTPFNKSFVQVNVPLTSNEGSAVAAFFAKTSSAKCHVVQILRIQNLKLWEKYVLKRKHAEEDIGAADLKEKFLFHGTKAENIVNICAEGFDMRVPTSNGALLGKGIYFSITSKYSERYADKSGMIFLARVICGWSQHGQKQMTRPQYHGTSRRMYDSCVDNVSSPTMYTVFDNSQCYPEYLIQFSN